MKKTLLTLALVAVTAASFAQGKINMVNDINHLVYFGTTLAPDAALSGQALTSVATPSGITFAVDLYGGATAGTMTLQQTTTMSATAPGFFGPKTFTSLNLPGGVQAFLQIKVRDAAFATAESSLTYKGFSQIFTFNPSGSIAFNSIVVSGGTALSTWTAGVTPVLGGNPIGAGFGAVQVNAVPEPTSMALAGIGAAAMVIFRRRK